MFSSLATFLFGSNTSAIANSETTAESLLTGENREDSANLVDADNLIEVTSLTPSVTGASGRGQQPQQQRTAIKRGGKNKRNNTRQQNKRKGILKNGGNAKVTTSLTKLLTPSDSCDEDFDEDDWFIVEKEDDEEDDSPSRSDSERENTPVNDIVKSKPAAVVTSSLAQQRRLQHINSHSLYSGPRPQKQRNYLQKTRGNTNSRSNGLSVSTLSPSRTVNVGRNVNGLAAPADGGVTRSLYVASAAIQQPEPIIKASVAAANVGIVNAVNNNKMEESWFVTPPPCFTSIGPINMETSPYENLLIEHPSMSVYHSIKSAQEATESFIKLDISVNEKQTEKKPVKETPAQRKNTQAVQQRSTGGYRLDKQSVAQLKQELMARTAQKTQSKKERKDICRSAIKRANKVRDVQSKNHTQRRSDRQYSKIVSNANNNRKSATCY